MNAIQRVDNPNREYQIAGFDSVDRTLTVSFKSFPAWETRVCSSHEEKLACRDLSYRLLLGAEYSLRSLHHARKWLGPFERQVYIGAYSKIRGELLGTFRLMPDYDPTQFLNIYDEVIDFSSAGQRFVDVGAYISPRARRKCSVFEDLFAMTASYLLDAGINGVYIQAQLHQVTAYARLGFSVASKAFVPEGWGSCWRGMFMRVDQMIQNYDKADFQKFWRDKTSAELNTCFWERVMKKVNSRNGWITGTGHLLLEK